MGRRTRSRLDEVLVHRGLAKTRSQARGLIMAGRVSVAGHVVDKAGSPTDDGAEIVVHGGRRFVSRAAEKLVHALEVFDVQVSGVRALDVGASTGGFTEVLLERGAERVIALDVGYGQLDQSLREDPRVVVMERTNARYLEEGDLPYAPDGVTMDVSFISLTKILPAVVGLLAPDFWGLALVKPQFEAGREQVGSGGIVRDPGVHADVLRDVVRFLGEALTVDVYGVCDSGLPGAAGNREFFVALGRGGGPGASPATLERDVARATGVDS